MSLLGQLSSSYGKNDTVGVLRDIDLVLGLGYDHPELSAIFRSTRDRIVQTLKESPEQGFRIRNDLFTAKNPIVENEKLSPENTEKLKGVDHMHIEYQRLLRLRQMMMRNPQKTLEDLISNIDESLKDYSISTDGIISVAKSIDLVNSDVSFYEQLAIITQELGHVGIIAFLEGTIALGKQIPHIIHFAKQGQVKYAEIKQGSMEYWDYTNILSIARTRQKIDENNIEGKSFSLSGGSGNTFVQLAIMQKYVEDGGKIKSISGTSAGSAMAILVASIGNDAGKIKELMNDFIAGNQDGSIPSKLLGHEDEMKRFYDRLIEKYDIHYQTKFSDLKIPVVVNAGRQYKGGEQEIVLGGDENVMDAIWASQNVPKPWKNDNTGALGITPVHGVNMIDYAANERGNPTHWLELLGVEQKDIVAIDVGYSSEKGGSPLFRRLFKRANTRDSLAKMRIMGSGGIVIDAPLDSGEGYHFPQGAIERFFQIGQSEYEKSFKK